MPHAFSTPNAKAKASPNIQLKYDMCEPLWVLVKPDMAACRLEPDLAA